MRIAALIAPVLLCMTVGLTAQAQGTSRRPPTATSVLHPSSPCLPPANELRRVALETWQKEHDANAVIRKLDAMTGYAAFEPTTTAERDGASIDVLFPSRSYRFRLMEAMRRREPIERVPVPDSVQIVVSVDRLTAPDVERVIVERAGKAVAPLSGGLRLVRKATAIGARTTVHEGTLAYSCDAFTPDSPVTVTAVTSSGENLTLSLDGAAIARLSGRPAPPIEPLRDGCVRPRDVGELDWNRMSNTKKNEVCLAGR